MRAEQRWLPDVQLGWREVSTSSSAGRGSHTRACAHPEGGAHLGPASCACVTPHGPPPPLTPACSCTECDSGYSLGSSGACADCSSAASDSGVRCSKCDDPRTCVRVSGRADGSAELHRHRGGCTARNPKQGDLAAAAAGRRCAWPSCLLTSLSRWPPYGAV